MDRLLLDTNFLLDLAIDSRPDSVAADELFERMTDGRVMGVVSPTSLKDFYYVARKGLDDAKRREWIALFMDAFCVAGIDRAICAAALTSDEPDFEDGIIRAIAEARGCDLLITRDAEAFAGSSVRHMSAAEYVSGK